MEKSHVLKLDTLQKAIMVSKKDSPSFLKSCINDPEMSPIHKCKIFFVVWCIHSVFDKACEKIFSCCQKQSTCSPSKISQRIKESDSLEKAYDLLNLLPECDKVAMMFFFICSQEKPSEYLRGALLSKADPFGGKFEKLNIETEMEIPGIVSSEDPSIRHAASILKSFKALISSKVSLDKCPILQLISEAILQTEGLMGNLPENLLYKGFTEEVLSAHQKHPDLFGLNGVEKHVVQQLCDECMGVHAGL